MRVTPFYTEKMFRAAVHIDGAMTQYAYGKKPGTVLARGIRLLTEHEPGFANLTPLRVELYQREHRACAWQLLKTLTYAEIPDEQQHWRKPQTKTK